MAWKSPDTYDNPSPERCRSWRPFWFWPARCIRARDHVERGTKWHRSEKRQWTTRNFATRREQGYDLLWSHINSAGRALRWLAWSLRRERKD